MFWVFHLAGFQHERDMPKDPCTEEVPEETIEFFFTVLILLFKGVDHSTDGTNFDPNPPMEPCIEYTIEVFGKTTQGTVSVDAATHDVTAILEGEIHP